MPPATIDCRDSTLATARASEAVPDAALKELERIISLLGDHVWIQIDEIATARFFGFGLDAIAAAQQFAARYNCVFVPDLKANSGRFKRAHANG